LEERYFEIVSVMYGDKGDVPVVIEINYREGRTRKTTTMIKIAEVKEEKMQ